MVTLYNLFIQISISYQRTLVQWINFACYCLGFHYSDVIMGAMTSQITSLTIVYSTIYSRADQRQHQSSASLAFVGGIHKQMNFVEQRFLCFIFPERCWFIYEFVMFIVYRNAFIYVCKYLSHTDNPPLIRLLYGKRKGSLWHVGWACAMVNDGPVGQYSFLEQ